jgi:opacity protein-like surface antigen
MRPESGLRTIPMAAVLATILGMTLWAPPTAAAESDRVGKWQFSFPVTFTSGTTVDGQEGTSFKLNDDVGFGVGFGFNLNPHLMLGVDFTWLSANYNASITADVNGDHIPDSKIDVSGTLDAATLQFVAQYNILKGRVTPFLRGSFGWTWVDSNIPAGAPVGGCWWDPWYGYICGSWQPTYGATRFAYGVAGGVRGELTPRFYLEASYNVLWLDTSKAGTPSFDGGRLTAGWTF